nr:peptidylprolyl isomerase [Planctomycetota bacterium]
MVAQILAVCVTVGKVAAGQTPAQVSAPVELQRGTDADFDRLLEAECKRLGAGKIAPSLARPLATKRFFDSGRRAKDDPDGSVRRAFRTEALRKLRIDAIVAHDRAKSENGGDARAVLALFEDRYGPSGEQVTLRHVLVSFDAERRRLGQEGGGTPEAEKLRAKSVEERAKARAEELAARARSEGFDSILAESDDRQSRRLLRDPKQRGSAGRIERYDGRRFGAAFARAVTETPVLTIPAPIASDLGWHVIRIEARRRTRFEDVEAQLRTEVLRRQATPR